jgi:hypothetical protein
VRLVFPQQWFDSVRNVFFTFLFPLVGGVILGILFFTTLIDSMDPGYGSASAASGSSSSSACSSSWWVSPS